MAADRPSSEPEPQVSVATSEDGASASAVQLGDATTDLADEASSSGGETNAELLPKEQTVAKPQTWVSRLTLTDFRNYASLSTELSAAPVVLVGLNGSGKTNLLEAVSMLAPGQGLRRQPYPDLARHTGPGGWTVAARLETADGPIKIGTGIAARQPQTGGRDSRVSGGRIVRIDNTTQKSSGALADYLEMVWLTPAMDGLFTGPAGDRRRFLDRLVLCVDPSFRTAASQYEKAMRHRNRLLSEDRTQPAMFDAIEAQLAPHGVAIAHARRNAVNLIAEAIATRRSAASGSVFAWAHIDIEGGMEDLLADCGNEPADAITVYADRLARLRPREREAKRTLLGPHRSDFVVRHGPKDMPAKLCSTGEQKALLINLVLAHAALVREKNSGAAPFLLLDEIAAHLDPTRRAALFEEILALGSQAWMTGTDADAFEAFAGRAQVLTIGPGCIETRA